MQIALSEAKAKLTALVRRAERGEPIVLTRNGKPVVRIVKEKSWAEMAPDERFAALKAIGDESRAKRLHLGKSGQEIADELYADIEASWAGS